ncbi:MAG: DNA-directed RNA polymerase subunit alpha [Parcubacteria group bacterium CG1_02_37_51]|uniref:DNA-directed RNA polymerase subunit alpha n=2 Tax=Candidatus Komeiliibacteriota TaxID=1817908 RepID=A0A2M8DPU6_9BACT|nr:MAG: DNA-directed RNA polymerase subunit alpha [Parcubacteria group bacterium CG1_02_37_51]PIY94527.1 MAG: DNA-directed RNA polymerase subunit alpha [Candidatus Komeilibacteria bacterium CG_4_10_14_0_8_um_filter_37_78]PJC00925.1 MAG: DNA-directed RNA polymerase subunit alpha [Candidatus Komeilibacteria bacterium CG_4_9_14_0_8_um_filter_36_9]
MLTITPPDKIKFNKISDVKSEVIIEPCYPGFGVTIGNSLRRVLLSSLDGAAIVGFKIAGVDHEFSTIPFVKEDAVDIILNLKKIRLKLLSEQEEDFKLTLSASGKKVVTAGDITKDSNIEIANPDQIIATLTDDKAKFEMEIFVREGRGYVTVEQRDKEKLEIGTISVDSLYSPVVNVGFQIESTRVGEMTNYEKLIMTIETNGTISPEEAIAQSVALLVDQYRFFSNQSESENLVTTDTVEQIDEAEEKVEELEVEKVIKKRGRPKKEDK